MVRAGLSSFMGASAAEEHQDVPRPNIPEALPDPGRPTGLLPDLQLQGGWQGLDVPRGVACGACRGVSQGQWEAGILAVPNFYIYATFSRLGSQAGRNPSQSLLPSVLAAPVIDPRHRCASICVRRVATTVPFLRVVGEDHEERAGPAGLGGVGVDVVGHAASVADAIDTSPTPTLALGSPPRPMRADSIVRRAGPRVAEAFRRWPTHRHAPPG